MQRIRIPTEKARSNEKEINTIPQYKARQVPFNFKSRWRFYWALLHCQWSRWIASLWSPLQTIYLKKIIIKALIINCFFSICVNFSVLIDWWTSSFVQVLLISSIVNFCAVETNCWYKDMIFSIAHLWVYCSLWKISKLLKKFNKWDKEDYPFCLSYYHCQYIFWLRAIAFRHITGSLLLKR